ncbi:MAG: NIPSNAP family containing protein [Methanobacteriota archaeon]|nr:MAG: NIPSNAP family containing protein [Euryarchaeota archaeon]
MNAVSQLRIYRIKEGRMEEWLAGWKRGVLPLRRKLGFRIEGAWEVRAEDTFVWILTYDGPEGFEARDAAYYASPERKALKPDPAELIEGADTYTMASVLSP